MILSRASWRGWQSKDPRINRLSFAKVGPDSLPAIVSGIAIDLQPARRSLAVETHDARSRRDFGAPTPGGYVDGFVVPVKREDRDVFRAFAEVCDPVFMEHGATWVVEAWGIEVPEGRVTGCSGRTAPRATLAMPG